MQPLQRRLIVILGGARSGKSHYAEQLATRVAAGGDVCYIATARVDDDEMRARVAQHRAQRPMEWTTHEEPLRPADVLRSQVEASVALLDCVTLLVSNILVEDPAVFAGDTLPPEVEARARERVFNAIDALLAAYQQGTGSLILVTNEVGMGVVPPYPLGRLYRDILGSVNARLVGEADAALLMVAGVPLDLTQLAGLWEARAAAWFDTGDSL